MLRIPSLRVAEEARLADSDKLVPPEMESVTSPPLVELTIGGENASVLLKPLGKSGIYRINIHYDKKFDQHAQETIDVRWRIVFNGVERVIDSHAFLPNR